MSDPPPAEVLRLLFQAAAEDGTAPGPHPADDLEQLTIWGLAQLPAAEEAVLVEHLARCAPCRRTVAALVREGVLEFPAFQPDAPAREPAFQPDAPARDVQPSLARRAEMGFARRSSSRGWRLPVYIGFALAASLLLVVGWLVWQSGPGSEMALARRALSAGEYVGARDRLERYLPLITDPAERTEAAKLLEEAGYTLARRDLEEKQFDAVAAAIDRWQQLGVASVRLDNLRLQAERRFPAEYALAKNRSLLDYGYEVDGSAPARALPEVKDADEAQLARWAELQARAEGDPKPALNRGQFLLALGRLDAARAVFEDVLMSHPDDGDAHTGLGLVAYQQRDYPTALTHFQAAVKQGPEDAAAHLNLAMTLERLDRKAEALPHWRQARERTTNEETREAIVNHLRP
jgi:tetratricopeptide (TPR) repeat protein